VRATAAGHQRPHRSEGVVTDEAGPHQIPERGGRLVRRTGVGQLAEEQRATGERLKNGFVQRRPLLLHRRRQEQRRGFGESERHPAVVALDRARAAPDDLAGGT
jgi:hypothetical protein